MSHFNLSYVAFDTQITTAFDEPTYGSLVLSKPVGHGREPAPVSPTDEAPFRILSGSVKAAYATHRGLVDGEDELVVSPGIKSGNTGALVILLVCEERRYSGSENDTGYDRYEILLEFDEAHLPVRALECWKLDEFEDARSAHDKRAYVALSTSLDHLHLDRRLPNFATGIRVDDFIEIIRYYTTLILNVDEARDM